MPEALPASSADAMRKLTSSHSDVLSLSPDETILMMTAGRTFTVYRADGTCEEVLVFFDEKQGGRAGSLFWNPGLVASYIH